MIWHTVHNEERLALWKKLRTDLRNLPLEEQLSEVAKFCAGIPFGSRTLDYYSPTDWPTPWDILYHSSFCTSSISLLIFYTLALIPVDAILELYLVEDEKGVYLLPVVNYHFVLNWELGQISKLPEVLADVNVVNIYTQQQIKTIT